MDPFTGMSQDEIKKIDEVLQSEQAKAILEESNVELFGNDETPVLVPNDNSTDVLNTSLENLSGLSDLDLESSIANEAAIPPDIFAGELPKPENPVALHDHTYSLPNCCLKSDEGKPDNLLILPAKTNSLLSSPIRRSRRQQEKIERDQREDDSHMVIPDDDVSVDEIHDLAFGLDTSLLNNKSALNIGAGSELSLSENPDSLIVVTEVIAKDITNLVGSEVPEDILAPSISLNHASDTFSPESSNVFKEEPKPSRVKSPEKRTRSTDEAKNSPVDKRSNKVDKDKSVTTSPRSPRRKQSLSEDTAETTRRRNSSLSEKEPLTKTVTPKVKAKRRRKPEEVTADLLGPALFSEPDRMVPVKMNDIKEKESAAQKPSVSESPLLDNQEENVIEGIGDIETKSKLSASFGMEVDVNELDLLKAEILQDQDTPPKAKQPPQRKISIDSKASIQSKPTASPNPAQKPADVKNPRSTTVPKEKAEKGNPSNIKDVLMAKNKAKGLVTQKSEEPMDTTDTPSNPAQPAKSPATKPITNDSPIAERKSQRTIQRKRRFDEDFSPDLARKKRASNPPVGKHSNDAAPGTSGSSQIKVGMRKTKAKAVVTGPPSDEETESDEGHHTNESDTGWDSDDDPDKLWCICRKPHNNKFMIECDHCADWYHGTCVNVTRQLGQKWEKEKREWHCPNCVKIPAVKERIRQQQLERQAQAVKQPQKIPPKNERSRLSFEPQTPTLPAGRRGGGETAKQTTPKEVKREERVMKPSPRAAKLEKDVGTSRNPIPKDFVLKSSDPRRRREEASKPTAKTPPSKPQPPPVKMRSPMTVLKSREAPKDRKVQTQKNDKTLSKTDTIPKSSPKNEKAKSGPLHKSASSKPVQQQQQVSKPVPGKQITLRELTVVNKVVVKERKIVGVAVAKEDPLWLQSCQGNSGKNTYQKNSSQSENNPKVM